MIPGWQNASCSHHGAIGKYHRGGGRLGNDEQGCQAPHLHGNKRHQNQGKWLWGSQFDLVTGKSWGQGFRAHGKPLLHPALLGWPHPRAISLWPCWCSACRGEEGKFAEERSWRLCSCVSTLSPVRASQGQASNPPTPANHQILGLFLIRHFNYP